MTLLTPGLKERGFPGRKGVSSPSGINLFPERNRAKSTKKPATESTRVQGNAETLNPLKLLSDPLKEKPRPFTRFTCWRKEAALGPGWAIFLIKLLDLTRECH